MKSSFKKVDKGATSQKCYFGHPQLDAVFSNSLTKGHLMIIQQDHPTTYYLSLLRYYISSNYHKSIASLIYDATPNRWKHLISPIMKTKQQKKQTEDKSEIAWRYDKMNIKLNQLVVSDEVDNLDLSKEVNNIKEEYLRVMNYPHTSLNEFYKSIQENFIAIKENQKDVRPAKILLSTIPSYFYTDKKFHQFLNALRCMTRSSHVFTLITVPPIISDSTRKKLLMYSDYYLQLGKVGDGYKDFTASIKVMKEIQTCQIRSQYRGESIWGIKNKKKQINIEALYEQAIQDEQQINNNKPLCSQQGKVDF